MSRRIQFTRSLAIFRLRRRLETESYPRLQMGLIVALTGAFGLVCSVALLHAGVGSMAMRYPFALALAYLFFLFLLWLWLRTAADDYANGLDLVQALPDQIPTGLTMPFRSGGGGDFGGAGASGSFDEASSLELSQSNSLNSFSDAAGGVAEAEEFAIPLLAIVLALGLALASLYVVYIAPVLFAELLLDGILSYSLYRHLRATDAQHWLSTAVRRTLLPFSLTAVFLALVGAAMAIYAPGAHSIGEVARYTAAKP